MTAAGALSTFLCGGGAAFGILCCTAPLARRLGWVDRPGERKSQRCAVPLVGGLALLSGIIAAAPGGLADPLLSRSLAALAALFLVGLADDAGGKGMRVRTKSLVTALVLVAFAGIPRSLGDAAALSTAFVILHSFNTSDNMNGLAAGLAGVSLPAVFAVLAGGPRVPEAACGSALAGALAVFLLWNFPRGRVYLGDSGSLLLGGWFALAFLESRHPALICFTAVPVADLVTVAWLRWRRGAPPWKGDRGHWSHRLAARGAGETRAVVWLWGAQLLCNATGLLFLACSPAPGPWATAAALALLAGASAASLATRPDPGSTCEGEPLGSR